MNYTDHSFIVGQSKGESQESKSQNTLELPEVATIPHEAVRFPHTGDGDNGVWLAPASSEGMWDIYYKSPEYEAQHGGIVSEGTKFLYNDFSDFPKIIDSEIASASMLEAGSIIMRSVVFISHIYAGQIDHSFISDSLVAWSIKSHVSHTVCVHQGQLWDSTVMNGWLSADVHHELLLSPVTFGSIHHHLVFMNNTGSWRLSEKHSLHADKINIYGLKSFKHENWLVSSIREALQNDDFDTVKAAIEQDAPIIDKKALEVELALPQGAVMPVDSCASKLKAAFAEYVRIVIENPNW